MGSFFCLFLSKASISKVVTQNPIKHTYYTLKEDESTQIIQIMLTSGLDSKEEPTFDILSTKILNGFRKVVR